MIYIKNHTANFSLEDGSYAFLDLYSNAIEKIACFFHIQKIPESLHKSDIIKEAFALMREIIEKNFYSGYSSIEERLRATTKEMHWHLAAFFNRNNTRFEMSCILLVIHSSKFYIVQRGRLAIGILGKDSAEFIGLKPKQMYERKNEIGILGIRQEDIRVDILEKKPRQNGSLFILPASSLLKINSSASLPPHKFLLSLLKERTVSYLKIDFSTADTLMRPKKKRITARASAIVLVIIVILAAGYGIFGKRWSQSSLSSGKEYMDEKKKTLFSPALLPFSQSPIFVEDTKFQWAPSLKPTLPPIFDVDNFYLIFDNIIICYRKSDQNIRWQKAFPHTIIEISLLRDGQILLVDSQGIQYLLQKQDGGILWKREDKISTSPSNVTPLIVIDYIRDGRLEKNYYITSHDNILSLVSVEDGQIAHQKTFQNPIDFVSDYDYVNKCLYIVSRGKIRKINIELK